MTRTNWILNRLNNYLPLHIKLALYNSLVVSHITYGILVWGHGSIPQTPKKAVRIISLKKFNSHTEPIFNELNLLKITDIYTLNEYKFYHKYVNNNLSHYFQTLPLNHNQDRQSHKTRNNNNIQIRRTNHEFANMCMRHNELALINNTDSCIKDKLYTHSMERSIKYVKCKFVQHYEVNCINRNYYICRTNNV